MQLKNITLLSKDEYAKYQSLISNTDHWWWLRTRSSLSGAEDYVFVVDHVGELRHCACFYSGGVRPLCTFKLDFSDVLFWTKPELLTGTKIDYGKNKWIVLEANGNELLALCDENIAQRRFDDFTETTRNPGLRYGVFDDSDIKRWLETKGLKLITE